MRSISLHPSISFPSSKTPESTLDAKPPASPPVSSITTSRSRHVISDVAARLEVAHPAIHVGSPAIPSTLTVHPQVVRIHSLLDNTRYLTQFVPNIPNVIAGLRAMHVQIPNSYLSQTTFIKTTHGGEEEDSAASSSSGLTGIGGCSN
ncbi:MAG: hypothetical protein M1813_008662 [Trichoglossum hirsutum]|jgi:hypothetical protein|nr:MAG: hypothetical protein M1813_008662 [Trichoglossum hirsutum]